MHRALPLLSLFPLAAAPAAAQPRIELGDSVVGRLSPGDPATPQGLRCDAWRFDAEKAVTYLVDLRSQEFDAGLRAGRADGAGCSPREEEDSGMVGTDALLYYHAETPGPHVIHVTSRTPGETGRYRLNLGATAESDTHPPPAPVYELVPGIEITQWVERDPRFGDGPYEDLWLYDGRAGERLTITMRSRHFPPALTIASSGQGGWEKLRAGEAGADGEIRLALVLPQDGTYYVHAGASREGQTGAYTIRAESSLSPRRLPYEAVLPPSGGLLTAGDSLPGLLHPSDLRDDRGVPVNLWFYDGAAGETVTFRMQSADFAPALRVSWTGDDARQIAADERGGSTSEVTVRLPYDGTYFIDATARGAHARGEYRISVVRR